MKDLESQPVSGTLPHSQKLNRLSLDAEDFDIMASVPSSRVCRGRGTPPSRSPQDHPYSRPYPRLRFPQFPPYPYKHSRTFRRHSTSSSPLPRTPPTHPYFNHPKRRRVQRPSPPHPAPVQFPPPSVNKEFRNLLNNFQSLQHHPHLPQYDYLSLRWVTEWDNIISPSPSFLLQLGLPVPEAVPCSIQTSSSSSLGDSSGLSSDSEDEGKSGGIHTPWLQNQQLSEGRDCGGHSVCGTLGHSAFQRLPVFSQLTEVHGQDIQKEEERVSFADALLDSLQLEPVNDSEGDPLVLTTSEQSVTRASSPAASDCSPDEGNEEWTVADFDDCVFEDLQQIGNKQSVACASSPAASVCSPDEGNEEWTVMDFDDCVFEDSQQIVNAHPPTMPRTANSQELPNTVDLQSVPSPDTDTEVYESNKCADGDSSASNSDGLPTHPDASKQDTYSRDRNGPVDGDHLSTVVVEKVHKCVTESGKCCASPELENTLFSSLDGTGQEDDSLIEEQDMDVGEDTVLNCTDATDTARLIDNEYDKDSGDCSDMDDSEPALRTCPDPERDCASQASCTVTSSLPPCIMSIGCASHVSCRHNPTQGTISIPASADSDSASQGSRNHVPSVDYQEAQKSHVIPSGPCDTGNLDRSVVEKSGDCFRVRSDGSCANHSTDLECASQGPTDTEEAINTFSADADAQNSEHDLANRGCSPGEGDQHLKSVPRCEEAQELKDTQRNNCNTQSQPTQISTKTSRPKLVCRRRGKARMGQHDHTDVNNASHVMEGPPAVLCDVRNSDSGDATGSESGGNNLNTSSDVSDGTPTVHKEGEKRRATKRPFICTLEMDAIIRILQQCDLLE